MLLRCQRILLRVCLNSGLRDSDEMNDLYQDIVCALWGSWPSFRGESRVETWVMSVALNVAHMQERRRRRGPTFVEFDGSLFDRLADEASEPLNAQLYRLIEQLSPDDQRLIYLYIDRVPLRQAAAEMNLSEDAVRQRIARIKRKLKKIKEKNDE